jgi:quercetin dioxygenase-like cupin family protein
MRIEVHKHCFNGLDGALEEVRRLGLWPTTILVEQAPEAELHWHAEDAHVYLVEGCMYYLDGAGNRLEIEAGDKIVVPARTVHAEGEIRSTVVLLIGLPEPTSKGSFLVARKTEEL